MYEIASWFALLKIEVDFREERLVVDLVLDRQSFFLIARRAEEIDQSEPLAIVVAVDQCFVREDCWRRYRARRGADRFAQIGALQVLANAFECEKVKSLVSLEWTTDRGAVLFAMKIFEWLAVGSVCCQCFKALEVKGAAMNIVCA